MMGWQRFWILSISAVDLISGRAKLLESQLVKGCPGAFSNLLTMLAASTSLFSFKSTLAWLISSSDVPSVKA
ncbi:hypothetical protein D3C85_1797210 [compost metagenome]